MLNLKRKIQKSLRHRGLIGTLKLSIRNLQYYFSRQYFRPIQSEFDQEFSVDTSGLVDLSDLDIENKNWELGVHYQASPPDIFRRILCSLSIKHEDFTFIDFGSGKGRTLLLASEFPFKKIIGIELSSQLHDIAQKNLRAYKSATSKCWKLQSVCVDASIYSIPAENAVFYFYHPFEAPVLSKVLSNIGKSLEDNPRDIIVVYYNPVLDHIVQNCAFLTKTRYDENCSIYTNRTRT